METRDLLTITQLQDFLRREAQQIEYPGLVRKTGVSKTTLHNFICSGVIPSVATLQKITSAYKIGLIL